MSELQTVAVQRTALSPVTINKVVEEALKFKRQFDLGTDSGLSDYVGQQAIPDVLKLRYEAMVRQRTMTDLVDLATKAGSTVGYIGRRISPFEIADNSMNGILFYVAVLDLLAYNGNRALAVEHSPVLRQFVLEDGTCQPEEFIRRVKEGTKSL